MNSCFYIHNAQPCLKLASAADAPKAIAWLESQGCIATVHPERDDILLIDNLRKELAIKLLVQRGRWVYGISNVEYKDNKEGYYDLRGVDLSGVDLSGCYLSGVDFCDANLSDTDLRESDIKLCQFDNANLSRANFQSAIVEECDIIKADLSEADFSHAALWLILMDYCNLTEAKFCGCDATEVCFRGCAMEGTDFQVSVADDCEIDNCEGIPLLPACAHIYPHIFLYKKPGFMTQGNGTMAVI